MIPSSRLSGALFGVLGASLLAGGLRAPWAGALAAALVWVLARLAAPVRFDRAMVFWGLWLGWGALSVLASDQPLKGVYSLSRWASAAVFFALARQAWGERERGRWLDALCAAGCILGLGVLLIPNTNYPFTGFMPPYYNYSVFVEAACVAALLSVLGRPDAPSGRRGWLLAAAGVFCLAMVFLARSRGGLAAIAAAAALAALRRGRARWLVAASLLGAGLLFLIPRGRLDYLLKLDQRTSFNRPQIWKAALSIVGENPLLGEGLGNFEQGFLRHNFPARRAANYGFSANHAHSEFLEVLAEVGIPGLLLLAAALLSCAAPGAAGGARPSLAREAALGALCAMLVQLSVDNMFHLQGLLFLFVSALAVAGPPAHPEPLPATRWRAATIAGLGLAMLSWLPNWILDSNWTLFKRAAEPERRLVLALESVRLFPADYYWREVLGRCWLQAEPPRPDLALREFERAASLHPTNGLYPHLMAELLNESGQSDRALALARQAVGLEPNYFAARFTIVELLARRGLKDEARRELDEVARRRVLVRGLSTHSAYDDMIVSFNENRFERLRRLVSR